MAGIRRREILARIGLAAFAYIAPAIVQLNGVRASSASSFSGPSALSRRSSLSSYSGPAEPPARREVVVALRSAADLEVLAAAGYEVVEAWPVPLLASHLARLRLASGVTLEAARADIAGRLPEATVEPNDIYRTIEFACGDDGCAAFEAVGWSTTPACASTVTIGQIDTAVNPDHPAFAGQALTLVDVGQPDRQAAGATHGTAIAALLIGSEGSTTPGLLPSARLLAVNAFHADSAGDAADVFSLIRGLDLLVARNVTVVNLSFAGPDNPLLLRTVDAAQAQGVALVAATGNDGPRAAPLYPAAYPGVAAVTAIDRDLQVYRQAVTGPHVAFAAPGVQVWTAASISGGRFRSGTSYAAPFVTAALAVLRDTMPDASPAEAIEMLAAQTLDLGDSGRDPTFGWGLVQSPASCRDSISAVLE